MVRQHEPDPWQEDYERQKAAGFPRQPDGTPSYTSSRYTPRNPGKQVSVTPISPGKQFLANWAPWGIGTFGLGIVMVIVAIVLHDHNALPNAVCHSGLGELGQAFSGTAYYQCSAAATAESAVGPLVFFGIGALLVGGGKMLLALVGAAALTKQDSAKAAEAALGIDGGAVPGTSQQAPPQAPAAGSTP